MSLADYLKNVKTSIGTGISKAKQYLSVATAYVARELLSTKVVSPTNGSIAHKFADVYLNTTNTKNQLTYDGLNDSIRMKSQFGNTLSLDMLIDKNYSGHGGGANTANPNSMTNQSQKYSLSSLGVTLNYRGYSVSFSF